MKKKNNATKTHGFIAIIVVLVLLCGVLAIGVVSTASTMASYSYRLENVYKRSFYELGTNVNDIEVGLSKVLATNDTKSQSKLLEDLHENSTMAVANIASLPLNAETLNTTTKFLNQMGAYAQSLSKSLNSGKSLTQKQVESLNKLYDASVYIQNKINEFSKTNDSSYNILKTAKLDKITTFSKLFDGFKQEGTEYPTLIYDGPFSDSLTNKEVKGLSGKEITENEAKEKLVSWFEGASDVNVSSDNKGKFNTYNFTFKDARGRDSFAQITKVGGLLLNYNSYCITKNENFKLKDLEAKSVEFAAKMGLNLTPVWSTKLNGVAYINLTSHIGETVVYPDMIKVKMCTDTGDIVGWEAQSYATNHTERKATKPTLSKAQAMAKVAQGLTIKSHRMCIVPLENGGETLAHEFECCKNNYTYYVYIDAKTGEQVKMLRVVATVSGDMII